MPSITAVVGDARSGIAVLHEATTSGPRTRRLLAVLLDATILATGVVAILAGAAFFGWYLAVFALLVLLGRRYGD